MTEIQKVILEIYKEVSAICEKHGLRYFAIGGTCLGAVRHKGFIPWDDDMDIAMPIEDYVKFIELCKTELPEHLELFSPDTAPHDTLKFIKIMDNRSMMTEEHFLQWKDTFEGVWLDIMPFPGVPEEGKRRKSFFRKIMYFRRMFCHTKHPFPEGRFRAKVFWLLVLPLRLIPYNFFWKSWMKFLQSYSFDSEKFTGFVWSWSFDRLIFPKEWFETTVLLPFEDTEMCCPKGFHEYLTQHFGDYMELPPEEERVSHHIFGEAIIDLDHSYKDYQNGKFPIPKLSKAKK